ncbi:hypothetical protein D3C84_1202050 [compost metagenome]
MEVGRLISGLMQGEHSLDDAARFLHTRLVAVGCQTGSGGLGEGYPIAPDPRQDVGDS